METNNKSFTDHLGIIEGQLVGVSNDINGESMCKGRNYNYNKTWRQKYKYLYTCNLSNKLDLVKLHCDMVETFVRAIYLNVVLLKVCKTSECLKFE